MTAKDDKSSRVFSWSTGRTMKHDLAGLTAQYFFSTAPLPCPYLPGRTERRLVTELGGRQRRRPSTTRCRGRASGAATASPTSRSAATAPPASRCGSSPRTFEPSRGQRRTLARNDDLIAIERPARATDEQYRLFRRYQRARHGGGEMARMDFADYQMLIEETPVDTLVVEFRDRDGVRWRPPVSPIASPTGSPPSTASSIPTCPGAASGTYMILWLVEWTALLDLPYVYLGFWVDDCTKMDYKRAFRPLEAYTVDGWQRLDPDAIGDANPFPDSQVR